MEIAERRHEALTKLDELKRQRGTAVMADKEFDQSEIAALEVELDALNDAEAAAVNKERETLHLKRNEERDKLRGALKALEAERLGIVQDMNVATRTVAEKVEQLLSTTQQMATAVHALTNEPPPVALMQQNTASRFGSRIGAIMAEIKGYRNRLGAIEWRGTSLFKAADDWRQMEQKLLHESLTQIIEGTD